MVKSTILGHRIARLLAHPTTPDSLASVLCDLGLGIEDGRAQVLASVANEISPGGTVQDVLSLLKESLSGEADGSFLVDVNHPVTRAALAVLPGRIGKLLPDIGAVISDGHGGKLAKSLSDDVGQAAINAMKREGAARIHLRCAECDMPFISDGESGCPFCSVTP